jgi:hypothetical protein
MTSVALALMQEVGCVGGIIRLEGGTLRLSAPEPLSDDLRARLRQHKAEIVALLAAAEPVNDHAPTPLADDQVGQDLPAEVVQGVGAILAAEGAQGVPPNRWLQVQRDMHQPAESRWLHTALDLGWTTAELFGCDQRAPWHRLDRSGLILLMGGHEIVELSSDVATLRTRTGSMLRFRRRPPAEPPVALLWELVPPRVHRAHWPPVQATGPPIGSPTAHRAKKRMAATFSAGPRRHPDHDHS